MSLQDEYKRLRALFNPSIRGKNTDSILYALGAATQHLTDSVQAVHDQIYISSATEKYLDQRLADYNLIRPAKIGLSDDVFRDIGIGVINRKQVRDLINELLLAMFGDETTNATARSSVIGPYDLDDGDTISIDFDGQDPVTITFDSSQFTNINTATAQEVADAITRSLRKQGKNGRSFAKDDGLGAYVILISDTIGPASSVAVSGGRAQNILKFPQIRPTTAGASTQWTVEQVSGGSLRLTWSGGGNPSMGKVRAGDYVNIYGSAFNAANRGSFAITKVKGGIVNNAYFEINNPNGVNEVVVQGTVDSILFFYPFRSLINTRNRYAAIFQSESRLLEVFIPATTKVVRRERRGAAHLHESGPSPIDMEGPYIYDLSQPFTISSIATVSNAGYDPDTGRVISVVDSSAFPDEQGLIILGYGTSHQEGPIPYLARPSGTSLLLNPSYRIQKIHPSGTDIALVAVNGPVTISKDGTDYPAYITDVVAGRIYAEELINLVSATGINVVITIIYPGSEGLGKWGTSFDEKTIVWGN